MSLIAERHYGDRNKWTVVAKANPLVDPASMKIGTRLVIPPLPSAPAGGAVPSVPPGGDGSTYTIEPGDTLIAIARGVYGDGALWERIYEANRATIGDDPATLKVGTRLVIPKRP